ncbi:hypothetical protein CGZ80_26040 [Rhodopirellula sp. MGV]|nr:hypothetical protein CGZ80_26040 [Rhodopirellula sp. MGV]PNY38836.1 hypothetical protein C2E31_02765 [Rhodopirellula baltica]
MRDRVFAVKVLHHSKKTQDFWQCSNFLGWRKPSGARDFSKAESTNRFEHPTADSPGNTICVDAFFSSLL